MMSTSLKKLNLWKAGLLIITAVLLGTLLAACTGNFQLDDGMSVTPVATPTIAPPTAPASQPTVVPNPTNPPPTATQSTPGYKPTIAFSAAMVEIGQNLTITGKGYPVNQKVYVLVGDGIQEWNAQTANGTTDASGNFAVTLKLDVDTYKRPLSAGQVLIQGTTTTAINGSRVAASARLTLVAPKTQPPAAKPELKVSEPVTVGEQLSLNGTGYPPNRELRILGGYNPDGGGAFFFGTAQTDANGNFSYRLQFVLPDGGTVQPGAFVFVAKSSDERYSARVTTVVTGKS
jgi:hypothetical protein